MMPARAVGRRVEVRPYRLKLMRPVRTSRGVHDTREGFLVFAHDGDLVGQGDAAPLPELGTESIAECCRQLQRASFDGLPETPAARCAVEQALLDLEAQRAGVPLARFLEGEAAFDVPASALLSAETVPELAREAQRRVANGFRTLKLKVGLDGDYARAAVVRDAVGAEVKLRLDANAAWDATVALRKLRELAPLQIELCEQPTADLLGLEASPIPIAADELLASDPDGALERAAVVVLKPMLLGGLVPALRLARRAHERGRRIIVTTSLESVVGRAGAVHLAAAVRALGPQPAAGIATGMLFEQDVAADPFVPDNGVVHIPAAAGLGLR
jgi:o-succinylbenzoate synthase